MDLGNFFSSHSIFSDLDFNRSAIHLECESLLSLSDRLSPVSVSGPRLHSVTLHSCSLSSAPSSVVRCPLAGVPCTTTPFLKPIKRDSRGNSISYSQAVTHQGTNETRRCLRLRGADGTRCIHRGMAVAEHLPAAPLSTSLHRVSTPSSVLASLARSLARTLSLSLFLSAAHPNFGREGDFSQRFIPC